VTDTVVDQAHDAIGDSKDDAKTSQTNLNAPY